MPSQRTTRADLARLVAHVQTESRAAGILPKTARLTLIAADHRTGAPWRLRVNGSEPFPPADGNGGDVGRTPREVEHTLRIMWATLTTVRKVKQ